VCSGRKHDDLLDHLLRNGQVRIRPKLPGNGEFATLSAGKMILATTAAVLLAQR
jgi:hypothetical protein